MSPSGRERLLLIDALRGAAILLMILFHFCFDLAYFRLADFDFYQDSFWLNARTVILSWFLLLVGVSLVLAARNGLDIRRYLPFVKFFAVVSILFGFGMIIVDSAVGMPLYWVLCEGPLVIPLSMVLLWLAGKITQAQ